MVFTKIYIKKKRFLGELDPPPPRVDRALPLSIRTFSMFFVDVYRIRSMEKSLVGIFSVLGFFFLPRMTELFISSTCLSSFLVKHRSMKF